MSHNAELKIAAEGAVNAGSHWGRRDSFERQLAKLATPEVILTLIAENERIQEAHEQICTNYNQVSYASEERGKQIDQLKAENAELGRYLCTCRDCGGEGSLHTGDWHSCSPMEPPEPVMEKCGECDGTGLIGEIQDLYQVITERDQLRAEVAGLRTGYEAYERVNAELKAECEGLRREREGKVLCDLELFETLRDSANTEADEHRQCMATYRPLRQANLDSVVKKCDDLLATVGQKEPAAEIIWCACGDGHAANSYGAGFMDANKGVCANCDAAIGKGGESNERS